MDSISKRLGSKPNLAKTVEYFFSYYEPCSRWLRGCVSTVSQCDGEAVNREPFKTTQNDEVLNNYLCRSTNARNFHFT